MHYKQPFLPPPEKDKRLKKPPSNWRPARNTCHKSKPKHIELGNDDCGEDLSSIAWVDAIKCTYDHGAPTYL
eukprot:12823034-Prorocentrum_lima.AAC.1